MSNEFAAGETFTDVSPGKSVTSTRLNNHVNGGTLLLGAITNRTDLSTAIASDDALLIYDTSAAGLKKVQAQYLLTPEAITTKTDISTAIASGDLLLMADVSASNALMKVQAANILPPEAITAKTDISTSTATDDLLLISDTSASAALKKVTVQNLLIPTHITSQTALTTPAVDDLLLISDTSASAALKKITLANLIPTFTSSVTAMNGLAAGKNLDEAHSLGAKPTSVSGVIVCTSGDAGYSVGDEIPFFGVSSASSANYNTLVACASATNVFAVQQVASSTFKILHKSTGADTAMDQTKWSMKIYARL